MHIYICIYIYVYMYMYIYTCICIYICIYVHNIIDHISIYSHRLICLFKRCRFKQFGTGKCQRNPMGIPQEAEVIQTKATKC